MVSKKYLIYLTLIKQCVSLEPVAFVFVRRLLFVHVHVLKSYHHLVNIYQLSQQTCTRVNVIHPDYHWCHLPVRVLGMGCNFNGRVLACKKTLEILMTYLCIGIECTINEIVTMYFVDALWLELLFTLGDGVIPFNIWMPMCWSISLFLNGW